MVDKDFDLKLLAPYQSGELAPDVTTIPRMFNLHAFNWVCNTCGKAFYQSQRPDLMNAETKTRYEAEKGKGR
jgi:hypothetical protein